MHIITRARRLAAAIVLSWTGLVQAGEMRKTVDGLIIDFGVSSSAAACRNPGHHDPAMHASPWSARGPHHLVVTVVDATSGQRVGDAKVRATVEPLGLAPSRKNLQRMTVHGWVSYGNYFDLSEPNLPATITVSVQRPGMRTPSTVQFQYGTPSQR
ncbi:MAG TPA: hypothetical protein VGD52_08330 [Pseudoduganella sp.]